ncbi:8-oxoguanine glycosylase ogg1 [Gurleya vavrai]
MGFGFVNVVPIDTHVFKVSKKLFNLEHKNLNDKNYKEIQEKFKEKYGEFCGIAQLYLFRKSIEDKKF